MRGGMAMVSGEVGRFTVRWCEATDRERLELFKTRAVEAYSTAGCESALPWIASEDDPGFAAFCLIYDQDESACAGFAIRIVRPSELSVTSEWGDQKHHVANTVAALVGDDPVVEAMAAWSTDIESSGAEMTAADVLAAQSFIVLSMTQRQFMVASSADHVIGRWLRSGARPVDGIFPSRWPTAEYATSLLIWEWDRILERLDPYLRNIATDVLRSSGRPLTAGVLELSMP